MTIELSTRCDKEKNTAHLTRLATAMAPDTTEWEFEGEIIDDEEMGSRCACGHPIRYVFVIRRKRDGATLNIGSTCIIQSVPFLTQHGAADLARGLQHANDELKKSIRERQKELKAQKAGAEIDGLLAHSGALPWRSAIRRARESPTAPITSIAAK